MREGAGGGANSWEGVRVRLPRPVKDPPKTIASMPINDPNSTVLEAALVG